MRGWEHILPGVRLHYVRSLADQRSASGTGVSTPCGAVLTWGITVFVPRLSDLYIDVWRDFSGLSSVFFPP